MYHLGVNSSLKTERKKAFFAFFVTYKVLTWHHCLRINVLGTAYPYNKNNALFHFYVVYAEG